MELINMTSTAPTRFVAYYRVSTDQQGKSGVGLDAQRSAVAGYVGRQPSAVLVAGFEEVESGKRSDRPQLAAALAACRAHWPPPDPRSRVFLLCSIMSYSYQGNRLNVLCND